jgi:guanylate kinase
MSAPGKIIVISAPSGGGKGSIINRLMEDDERLIYSVSATTRAPRPGERNGREYIFLSRDEFEQWLKDDQFIEWAEVHDQYYGTPKQPLEEELKTGRDVLLEVDVQGMRQVRASGFPDIVTIFIMPPSKDELEKRLRGRGDLNEAQLARRLNNADAEIAAKDEFDYVVVNDDLDAAVQKVETILQKTRS